MYASICACACGGRSWLPQSLIPQPHWPSASGCLHSLDVELHVCAVKPFYVGAGNPRSALLASKAITSPKELSLKPHRTSLMWHFYTLYQNATRSPLYFFSNLISLFTQSHSSFHWKILETKIRELSAPVDTKISIIGTLNWQVQGNFVNIPRHEYACIDL